MLTARVKALDAANNTVSAQGYVCDPFLIEAK